MPAGKSAAVGVWEDNEILVVASCVPRNLTAAGAAICLLEAPD
jgi:hypothetical protein